MKTIIITGSEGLVGTEISRIFKNHKILKLDIKLGHDLTNEDFVRKWFKQHHADCLINCFALNDHIEPKRKKNTLYDITLDSFSKYIDVNLTALFSVCRQFARNNKNGIIINFSSIYGIVSPRPDFYNGSHKHIGYAVSKAGVINLTKYLAAHLSPNIKVNCITLGGILSNQDKQFIKKYSSMTPMKRMMKKTELKGLIEYLCSNQSSYITGSNFILDGGYTIW